MTTTITSGAADLPEALPAIQRFEVVDCIDSEHVPAVIPKPHGPWVRYEDHAAVITALRTQQPAPAGASYEKALEEALRERDDADDFIDALLDEVLGTERAEWSSAYGRAEVLEEVRERITALHKPAVDRAWKHFEVATQQAGEVRPVTPYTCPKCHALWLHWPAEQTGFGCDTLNCRSADHCHYCEKASVEQLQRLERIPAALHAPQPSPTAQAAESVPTGPRRKDMLWSTVKMQERHDQRIENIVSGLERIKQEHAGQQPQKIDECYGDCPTDSTTCTNPCRFDGRAARAPAEGVLEDAARYRLVRRGQHWSVINGIGNSLRAEELDAAVDAARKQGANHD